MSVTAYTCKLEYLMECSKCPTTMRQPIRLMAGQSIPLPTLPTGWRNIEGRVYCAGHSVTVVVDP